MLVVREGRTKKLEGKILRHDFMKIAFGEYKEALFKT